MSSEYEFTNEDSMTQRKFVFLFGALFLFMVAWSVGLANPVMEWLDPATEYGSYIINKGVLALVMALVLWRLRAFAAVGFRSGMGLASYLIGIPLMALGVMSLLDPNRPTLTPFDLAGWAVAIILIAFTEETLFRGILWKGLEEASLWTRAIVTSVMFGLIHFIPAGLGDFGWGIGAAYGLSAAGFGMTFAAMRERAASIWSVVIAHVVFDLAAISQAGSVDTLLEPGPETYIRFLTAAVVFSAWGSGAIYLLNRRAARALRKGR
jgi:membrane protease YdiL (CAAX protease family)